MNDSMKLYELSWYCEKRLGLDCVVRSEGGAFSLGGLEPLSHDRVNGLMSGSRQYSWFGMHGRWKLFWFSPTGYSQNSVVQLDSPVHLYLISPSPNPHSPNPPSPNPPSQKNSQKPRNAAMGAVLSPEVASCSRPSLKAYHTWVQTQPAADMSPFLDYRVFKPAPLVWPWEFSPAPFPCLDL